MLICNIPERDHNFIAFPIGIIYGNTMALFTPHRIGQIIKAYRLEQKLTQAELAKLSGTGLRFIVELERGKPTVQLGKLLQVMGALGLEMGMSRAEKAQTPVQTDAQKQLLEGVARKLAEDARSSAVDLAKKDRTALDDIQKRVAGALPERTALALASRLGGQKGVETIGQAYQRIIGGNILSKAIEATLDPHAGLTGDARLFAIAQKKEKTEKGHSKK